MPQVILNSQEVVSLPCVYVTREYTMGYMIYVYVCMYIGQVVYYINNYQYL